MGVEVAQPDTSSEALRRHFTNEGGANGEFLLLKLVTGLWIIQECLQHWRTHGQAYQHKEVMEAAAQATSLRSIFDPNDKRLSVHSNMPVAIEDYCRATGQPAPETAGAFARSALESLSLKYRSVLESLEFLTGRHLRTLRVVGGGSLNSLLCQMIADACDRVVVSGPAEASALGNVMMQAIATNHLPDIQAGRRSIAESVHRRTFEPRRSDAWDEAYAQIQGPGSRLILLRETTVRLADRRNISIRYGLFMLAAASILIASDLRGFSQTARRRNHHQPGLYRASSSGNAIENGLARKSYGRKRCGSDGDS